MKSAFKVLLMAAAIIVFARCSDDDEPALEYRQQGFVKGTIAGTTGSSSAIINESFTYSQYLPGLYGEEGMSYYEINDDGSIYARVIRHDVNTGGYVGFYFTLDDENDVTPEDVYYIVIYRNNNLDGKAFDFSTSSSGNDFSISDFSFDISSGRTKGKYVLEGTSNTTSKNATVTGEFDVVIKQVVY
jgi:hypothetical protein